MGSEELASVGEGLRHLDVTVLVRLKSIVKDLKIGRITTIK